MLLLVWARRLRQSQLSEIYASFDNVDADSDGAISFMELIAMVKLEGFTLTKSEASPPFKVHTCMW